MNYGIAVCKLKSFEPLRCRSAGAARRGVEGGPGWQARDLASEGGPPSGLGQVAPSCSVPQFLSVGSYTCLKKAKPPPI